MTEETRQEAHGTRCSHRSCNHSATHNYHATRARGVHVIYPRCDEHPLGNAKSVSPIPVAATEAEPVGWREQLRAWFRDPVPMSERHSDRVPVAHCKLCRVPWNNDDDVKHHLECPMDMLWHTHPPRAEPSSPVAWGTHDPSPEWDGLSEVALNPSDLDVLKGEVVIPLYDHPPGETE